MRIAVALSLIALASAPASAQQQTAPGVPPMSPRHTPAAGRTADQCRTTCAQTYYFCLVESEAQDCSPRWSQCRQACNGQGAAGPR